MLRVDMQRRATSAYETAVEQARRDLRELEKQFADLEGQIQHLKEFIRSGSALAGKNGQPQRIELRVADSMSLADRVALVLTRAGKPLTMKQIIGELPPLAAKNPTGAVWAALKRRKGQFKKLGHGGKQKYGLIGEKERAVPQHTEIRDDPPRKTRDHLLAD
jgi:hypothetical protein